MQHFVVDHSAGLSVTTVMVITPVDPGKTLPEALDYCTVWLQTVAGEVDAKSGIPPPLITVQIKDFLNGPGKPHT